MLPDGGASDLARETMTWRWMDDHRCGRHNPSMYLTNTVRQAQLQKILVLAPTNNATVLLGERLQEDVPVFNEKINRWLNIVPIYKRLGSEHDTKIRAALRATRDSIIPQSCQQLFQDISTLHTLGSVYRVYQFQHVCHDWTNMIPYKYVLVEKHSKVSYADLFPLFNSNGYTSHPYEQRWTPISFIGDPYQLPPITRPQRPRCY